MNCNQAREFLLDLAQGETLRQSAANREVPAVEEHVRACAACSRQLEELRQTMSLLDEWVAPEPSPYFDSRLRARVRAAAAETRMGWLSWLRKPAIAGALAMLMVAGATLVRQAPDHPSASLADSHAQVTSDPAVRDLKDLDQNLDMYANFDVLDDLSNQQETP